MARILGAVLLWLMAAAAVQAGAWLQNRGKGFLSVSTTARQSSGFDGPALGLYAEYGLRERLTIGLDVNAQRALATGNTARSLAFARVPLLGPEGPLHASAEIALGLWRDITPAPGGAARGSDPLLRLQVAVGRGFASWGADGWININAGYERAAADTSAFKLDATIGLSHGPWIRPLLQIETWTPRNGASVWTVTASAMHDITPSATLVIGVQRKSPDATLGVRLSLWRRF